MGGGGETWSSPKINDGSACAKNHGTVKGFLQRPEILSGRHERPTEGEGKMSGKPSAFFSKKG